MIDPKAYLEAGQPFHGHECPAMPLGLRVGAAAMNRLGVDRAPDGQLVALVELGDDHCAHCFADGIQMITGCTFGKGNIQQLHYGKWGVTLIDRVSGRALRVVPKAEAMLANKQSDFFKKGGGEISERPWASSRSPRSRKERRRTCAKWSQPRGTPRKRGGTYAGMITPPSPSW